MCKFFLFLLLSCLAFSNALDQEYIDQFMEKLEKIAGVCSQETHASAADIAELVSRTLPPSTHEGKCMIFCIQKKFELMNEDGTLNKSGAVNALAPLKAADPELYEKVLKLFISCGMSAKIHPDPCDTATDLAICGQEKAKEMGLDDLLV